MKTNEPEDWEIAIDPPEPQYPSLGQFRTPVDDGYVALVGQAVYAFTYLEWQMVSIGQKLDPHVPGTEPGFIHKSEKWTAGKIAENLLALVEAFARDAPLRADLKTVAVHFQRLVARRNALLHAHPATLNGQQRLHRWSTKMNGMFSWEPDDLVAFIHDVEALAGDGNRLFYDKRM